VVSLMVAAVVVAVCVRVRARVCVCARAHAGARCPNLTRVDIMDIDWGRG